VGGGGVAEKSGRRTVKRLFLALIDEQILEKKGSFLRDWGGEKRSGGTRRSREDKDFTRGKHSLLENRSAGKKAILKTD